MSEEEISQPTKSPQEAIESATISLNEHNNLLPDSSSEQLPELQHFTYGSIYINEDKKFVHTETKPGDKNYAEMEERGLIDRDDSFPPEGRLERVEYRRNGDMNKNKVIIVNGIPLHPDERVTGEIAFNLLTDKKFKRTELYLVHPGASYFESRYYVVPYTEINEKHWNPRGTANHVVMSNMKIPEENIISPDDDQTEKPVQKGIKVDLNRQVHISDTTNSYEDLYQSNLYPDAKLALKIIEDSPEAEVAFTFHEDDELGFTDGEGVVSDENGYYVYYCPNDARTDKHLAAVKALHEDCCKELQKLGFAIFDGIDDKTEPALGLKADKGFIYQPIIDMNGQRKLDGSFENAVVALSQIEGKDGQAMSKIMRSFCFEIPHHLSAHRKQELVKIITDKFIIPYLQQNRLYQE